MYNHWAPQSLPSFSSNYSSQVDINSNFPSLSNMSFTDLAKIENDNDEINKMVDESTIIKEKMIEKEDLMAKIKSLAEYNLSTEPKLNRMKIQLSQTHEQAREVFKEYETNKTLLDTSQSPEKTSKEVQLALLQTETAKIEEECENLTSSFHNEEIKVEDFLKGYLEKRKLSHIRRIKAEKMSELIRNPASNSTNNIPYPPYHASYSQPMPYNSPYNQPSLPFQPQPPYSAYAGNTAFSQPSLY